MRNIGLYYPYVHIQDDAWMKAAALYWPRMARVVPDGYPVRDSSTARALAAGLNFFVPLEPSPAATALESRFLTVIQENGEALHRLYAVRPEDIHPDDLTPPAFRTANHSPSVRDIATHGQRTTGRRIAQVYWEEVTPDLRDALITEGLALNTTRRHFRSGYAESTWLSLDPMMAWVYKCALTSELAGLNQLIPTTDQVRAHEASLEWDSERITAVLLRRRPAPVSEPPAAVFTHLALRMVLPENIGQIPVEKIIDLRTRYKGEFSTFMNAVTTTVQEVREELAGIQDRVILHSYLEQVLEDRFKKPLADLKAAMKGLNINTAFGALNVQAQLPALSGALGGLAVGQPYLTAGGLAFGLAAFRHATVQQRDETLASSPMAYLLLAERGLGPAGLLRRMTRGAQRAIGSGI